MKTNINQVLNLLKSNSTINVDIEESTVFVEAENESIYILLDNNSLSENFDIQIYINDVLVNDDQILDTVANWITNYAETEIDNQSSAFSYQDKLHATNLIYS